MTYKNIIKLSESLLLQYEDGYLFTFKLKYSFDNNTSNEKIGDAIWLTRFQFL